MRYVDGHEMRVGDSVQIHGDDHGIVVAVFDARQFSDTCPESEWSHLTGGIMVDTNFAGLVHYQSDQDTALKLLKRGNSAGAA